MLRSPTRRQAGSRRQKALGSPGRVAKIDKALAAGPDLSDEQVAEVKRLRDEGERLHKTGHEGGVERLDAVGAGRVFGPSGHRTLPQHTGQHSEGARVKKPFL